MALPQTRSTCGTYISVQTRHRQERSTPSGFQQTGPSFLICRRCCIEGSTFITTEFQFARLALPFHLGTKKERGRVTSMTEAMCISLWRLPALTLEFELLRYRSFFRLTIVLAAVEAAVRRCTTVLTVSCFCEYGLLSRTIQI
jgi:hypothetical protein